MDREEEMNEYIIPVNVGMTDSVGKYKIRNIIEAVAATALVLNIITAIPFVADVKVITSVILGLGTFLFFMHGIKDESVTGFLFNYIRFKTKSGSLRLRVAGLTKTDLVHAEYRNNFEKIVETTKKKVNGKLKHEE